MATPLVFDRQALRQRRRRALALGPADFLAERAADELAGRLATVMRQFEVAADLFSPAQRIRDSLAASGKVGHLIAVVAPGMPADAGRPTAVADEEALPLKDGALDLAVSLLALQTVNDLPGLLVQVRRALKPDGLFLGALLGGATLGELRQSFAEAEIEIDGGLSPRVAPFADVREIGALLQRAGFALPVTDLERITVRYASPLALMQDLRRMSAGNALADRVRRPLRRRTLARMIEVYGQRFADADGRIRATFDLVWFSGWAPHASQQKPLRPGSAQARLADALGTREISAGEKAGPALPKPKKAPHE